MFFPFIFRKSFRTIMQCTRKDEIRNNSNTRKFLCQLHIPKAVKSSSWRDILRVLLRWDLSILRINKPPSSYCILLMCRKRLQMLRPLCLWNKSRIEFINNEEQWSKERRIWRRVDNKVQFRWRKLLWDIFRDNEDRN